MNAPLPPITDSPPKSDLLPRVIVGVLLIALALGEVWLGGWSFAAFAGLGGLLIFAEWAVMHRIGRGWRFAGLVAVGLAAVATQSGHEEVAAGALLGVATVLGLLWRLGGLRGARWMFTGLLYAGLPVVALLWLRLEFGFDLVIWLLALVWATDIFAYFAGRAIGGPKIAPKISPKKTWAGLGGGMVGAAATSAVLMPLSSGAATGDRLLFAALGAGLAVVAQAGDFFESWLKRRVGVKDSGTLLPGHGGIMDRVDGLVPVAVLVALVLDVADWVQ